MSAPARCTLITGARRRLGRLLAETLLAQGEQVIAHGRHAAHAPDLPGSPVWLWDLQEPLPALPAHPITDLVLNASHFERGHAWRHLHAEDRVDERRRLQTHLQVNVTANWELAVALSAAHPLQSIVVLLDTYYDRPLPHHAAYQVSRAAGAGLVRALAVELAPIRVNAIAPGTVLPSERAPEHRAESAHDAAARTLITRAGTPQDVIDAILYLRDAAYSTGEILRVDGGRFAVAPPRQTER